MTELHFQSATRLMSLLETGEVSARELLDHFLDRIERHNPALNAIIWQDNERARAEADASDARRARGEAMGPLDGLPMTVKESFDLTGAPTTWGRPSSGTTSPSRILPSSRNTARQARSYSARPTCRSCWPIGRASTRSMALATTPGIWGARPAGPPAGRRRRWRRE